jgi:D,D-heptose 1,7-bisphosphate phosphatase
MLDVGGRPFLAWIMGELVRFGVSEVLLLTGHLSGRVHEALDEITALLPKPLKIAVSVEPSPAGTGGALHHARDLLDDRFLLCNGDSLFDFNVARLLADAMTDPAGTGRIALRATDDASRYGVVETAGSRVVAFHERGQPGVPALVNAGIYVFDRGILDHVSPACSLERDVLPRLAAMTRLQGTQAGGYFIDIGIPDDYARAQAELPGRLARPALFLDRDGVINVDHGWVGTRERFEWIPGARDAIAAATADGWHVFVVTNQSGVARGFYDEASVHTLHAWLLEQVLAVGGTIDDVRYCPYHPDASVEQYRGAHAWRKPEPGMILDLIRAWRLDPTRCRLVGDQPSDIAAAHAAGIQGHLFPGGNLASFVAGLSR